MPERRLSRKEITGRYEIKTVIKYAHAWTYDRNRGSLLNTSCWKIEILY
jgi:hypothetical protein